MVMISDQWAYGEENIHMSDTLTVFTRFAAMIRKRNSVKGVLLACEDSKYVENFLIIYTYIY